MMIKEPFLVKVGDWFIDHVPGVGGWIGGKIKYCKLNDKYWEEIYK